LGCCHQPGIPQNLSVDSKSNASITTNAAKPTPKTTEDPEIAKLRAQLEALIKKNEEVQYTTGLTVIILSGYTNATDSVMSHHLAKIAKAPHHLHSASAMCVYQCHLNIVS
jgi:hypothetical protein